jgi:hypothetical protein
VSHEAVLAFLEGLLLTDFPTLLLWSQPQLARRAFTRGSNGTLTLAPSYRVAGRPQIQFAQTCLGYVFGYAGRLSPRDGWVGACFGTFTTAGTHVAIAPAMERFVVEPDLAWFRRRWPDLARLPLTSGQGAWEYLTAAAPTKLRPCIRHLREQVGRVEEDPLDFGAVDSFLRDSASGLARSLCPGAYELEPHQWWIHRMVPAELELSSDVARELAATRADFREGLRGRGALVNEEGFRHDVPVPYPLRIKMNRPERIVQDADEWFDWVVTDDRTADETLAYFPIHLDRNASAVFQGDARGIRFLYVEPNPRRVAERFAARMPSRPAFVNELYDLNAIALAPPEGCVDNRLIRIATGEHELERAPHDVDALFFSTLMSPVTSPHFGRELLSPRYRRAHDIVPIFADAGDCQRRSFGRLYRNDGVWSLSQDEARATAKACRNGLDLARLFFLEIAPPLNDWSWLVLMHGQKRHALSIRSEVSWLYLHHVLRTTDGPVTALMHSTAGGVQSALVDARGDSLPIQLMIRG